MGRIVCGHNEVVFMSRLRAADRHSHNPLVRYFKILGPGLVTGAADDDPSGITTYSVAGASLGYGLLWMAVLTFPLMTAVQLICARIGLVTGRGLAAAIRDYYPRPYIYVACLLLLVANVFNIAADLSGMASVTQMLTGVPPLVSVLVWGLLILLATIYSAYTTLAQYLKWLTAALFAYVVTAFLAKPDWGEVARATLIPHLRWDSLYVTTMVAVLGTTISPYLFFWQASHEVEEEKAQGRRTVAQRRGATAHELSDARLDVATGMFFSNLVMFFIVLTAGATLHTSGRTELDTARQAAEALRPLAGDAAYLLFAVGLIGTGLLAVPVLAGSASFAISEVFGWRSGLNLRPWRGRWFYLVFATSVIAGMALNLAGTNPIRMLFLSALLNGLLAPPLLLLVMLVGSNPAIMGKRTNGPWLNVLGWLTTALMFFAAIAFFVTSR
jgi:NRAMP (natural resistance-associated macrophage protein)-like metal ion transporter